MYLEHVENSEIFNDGSTDWLVFCEHWGLSRFMPIDLKGIKRISLGCVSDSMREEVMVSKVLRLCGGVEDLFMVESNLDIEFDLRGAKKDVHYVRRGEVLGLDRLR